MAVDQTNPLQSRDDLVKALRDIARNPNLDAKDHINALNKIADIRGLKAKHEEADWRKKPQGELERYVKDLLEDALGPYAEIEWPETANQDKPPEATYRWRRS